VTAFAEFLETSQRFWRTAFAGYETADTALIEGSLGDEYLLHGILKVGLIFSRLNGLKPIVAPPVRRRGTGFALIRSMCPTLVPIRWLLVTQLLRRLPRLLQTLRGLRTGADVVALDVGGAAIGPYVYDCVVGRFHVPTIDRLTWSMKLYALFLLLYLFAFQAAVRAYRVKLVVLHDPAYLCGLLFQICRVERIKCINAINLTIFQMRRYLPTGDYTDHYRKVEPGVLARIPDEGPWRSALDDYMKRRLAGRIDQHDVLTAYAPDKIVLSRAELERTYALPPGRPLVILMAHVFSDAPHAFGGGCSRLLRLVPAVAAASRRTAPSIFFVKVNPSATLYGEAGLSSAWPRITAGICLRDDVHTETILRADYVDLAVPIGPSSACSKPATRARPPFAGLGFTRSSRRPSTNTGPAVVVDPAPAAAHRTTSADGAKAAFVTLEMMDATRRLSSAA
jgi:hypothetical protein